MVLWNNGAGADVASLSLHYSSPIVIGKGTVTLNARTFRVFSFSSCCITVQWYDSAYVNSSQTSETYYIVDQCQTPVIQTPAGTYIDKVDVIVQSANISESGIIYVSVADSSFVPYNTSSVFIPILASYGNSTITVTAYEENSTCFRSNAISVDCKESLITAANRSQMLL